MGDLNPVFIVGCPRSGTTWVQRLLWSHSQVGEVVRGNFGLGDGNATETGCFLRKSPEAERSDVEIMEGFCKAQAAHPGKVLVEKTPHHLFEVERIRRVFPEARVVWVLRHPYAVAASCHQKFNFPLVKGAEWWVKAASHFDHWRQEEDGWLYTVRYEAWMRALEVWLPKLLEWLGLEDESEALVEQRWEVDSDLMPDRREKMTEIPVFPPRYEVLLRETLGDWPRRLGYQL